MKKYSYIDHVIINNTREHYPLPGPGAHFHDKKTVRKMVDEENRDLIVMKQIDGTKAKTKLP